MSSDSAVMWYYTEDRQQKGPVDEKTFTDLARRGGIGPSTLVWRSGMASWLPYGEVTGMASIQAQEGLCSYCGKPFPSSDLIDFNGTRVCAACKPLFVQQYRENAEAVGRLGLRYAGFWVRVAANVLDGIIIGISVFIVVSLVAFVVGVLAVANKSSAQNGGLELGLGIFMHLFGFIVGFAYYVIPLVKWGATPGKMACGLKVVRSDGSPLTLGRAIGRYFGNMLSQLICNIGHLMVAFDQQEHKALHDIICDTRVVYKN